MPVKLNGEYYGTAEAAEVLDRTISRVRQMIRAEEISAVEISKQVWLIPAREVRRILREREARRAAAAV